MMPVHSPKGLPTSADEALQRLMEGNARFVRGEAHIPSAPQEVLADLANGQRPYATILGCADSRVPPELIFGAGLGDLFVVRVAGNSLSPEVAGSLQYAGVHLGTMLLVIPGATRGAARSRRLWKQSSRIPGSPRESNFSSTGCSRHCPTWIRGPAWTRVSRRPSRLTSGGRWGRFWILRKDESA